ncbi:HAD family hydrolase [Dactylosporangium roseum]|uniref:HAD family hydrolase n=1 Tax=Dactylosporangium roseum TaxID=47989 RepID=A0ABY5ZBA0_9ACTN|nr:HAD family hydrolase [Dactylosporangium roseum]UWZ39383.1 HAD family hydrolase [Dactylosporangium roseum]
MTGAPAMPVKGVIFDLDGTLANTPDAITAILQRILIDREVHVSAATVRSLVGRPLEQSIAHLLGLSPGDPEVGSAARDYHKLFREFVEGNVDTLAYPEVGPGLARLRDGGLRLAVATSKPRRAAERILRLMGLAAEFGAVAGDDTVPEGKPHPGMALYVAGRLGLGPAECVVVGDGVADIAMGVAAGMQTIGVSYGVATAAELIDAGADRIADTFGELVALIGAETERTP